MGVASHCHLFKHWFHVQTLQKKIPAKKGAKASNNTPGTYLSSPLFLGFNFHPPKGPNSLPPIKTAIRHLRAPGIIRVVYITGWWLNQPVSEKYARQSGFIFPMFLG